LYYHTDALPSVVTISGAGGGPAERNQYVDFGQPHVFDGAGQPLVGYLAGNPLLYTRRRFDPETQLSYYRTRYLEARAGRFLTRDTIGVWGDAGSFGNALAYVHNRPTTLVDPRGEACTECDQISHRWVPQKTKDSKATGKIDPVVVEDYTGYGGMERFKSQLLDSMKEKIQELRDRMTRAIFDKKDTRPQIYAEGTRVRCVAKVVTCAAAVGYSPYDGPFGREGTKWEYALACELGCTVVHYGPAPPPPDVGQDLISLAMPGNAILRGGKAVWTLGKWTKYMAGW
jgi:RHS repeat-associated protein